MQLNDLLNQIGGLKNIAGELGISEQQAASGAEALAPALLGGFKKKAQANSAGLGAIGGLLGQFGGGDLLDNVLADRPTDTQKGDNVLAELFGSKDVSRAVANDAATKSGIDATTLKKMLPMLAMMVSGFMAKSGGTGNLANNAPDIGGLLGGLMNGGSGDNGGLQGIASLLDMDGDGNPLDDVLGLLKR